LWYDPFTDEIIRDLLSKVSTASVDENGWKNVSEEGGSKEANNISFNHCRPNRKYIEDVRRIKDHPLVPTNIPVYGYIFDVKSGKLIEIPETTKLGKTAKLKKKPVCFLKF
jgi:carbonic anhydrase